MLRIGRTIKSAKIKDITPPKLIPPFHKTAANGTLPIEHTKEITATKGPTRTLHIDESTGWSVKKKLCQNECGTQAARAPAIKSPRTISFQTEAQSMMK